MSQWQGCKCQRISEHHLLYEKHLKNNELLKLCCGSSNRITLYHEATLSRWHEATIIAWSHAYIG